MEASHVDRAEAERRATAVLAHMTEEFGAELAWWPAETRDVVRETDQEFVFHWNSAEHVRTGDILNQILVGPIVVPKDGSPPWTMGTALSEDEFLRQYWNGGLDVPTRRRGVRVWP